LHKFYRLSISSIDKALCQLFIIAFFFTMRSCKYIKVSGKRKTKLLTLKNIKFYKNKKLLDHEYKYLHLADTISLTFEQQKRDTKNDTITHHQTKDKLLCPVKNLELNSKTFDLLANNKSQYISKYFLQTRWINPPILRFRTTKQTKESNPIKKTRHSRINHEQIHHNAVRTLVK
jgi:hypothetical protein